MLFEFTTTTHLRFGRGTVTEAPEIFGVLGCERVFLITGRTPDRAQPLRSGLASAGCQVIEQAVPGEPTLELVRAAAQRATSEKCDAVAAFGGGSAIDAGKVVAALATNRGDPRDYLEVIGRGRTLERPALPFVAIPTTSGTGAEVTKAAILLARHERVKAAVRSHHLQPTAAIVDPDLADPVPTRILRLNAMVALAHLVESFISRTASPITDALAREGLRQLGPALRDLGGQDATEKTRDALCLAGLLGGLCATNAGSGITDALTSPASGMLEAPSREVTGALLAPALEAVLRAMQARNPANPAIERLREFAVALTGRLDADANQGIVWLRQLGRELGVQSLAQLGMAAPYLPLLIERAKMSACIKEAPIALSDEELAAVASHAMQPL